MALLAACCSLEWIPLIEWYPFFARVFRDKAREYDLLSESDARIAWDLFVDHLFHQMAWETKHEAKAEAKARGEGTEVHDWLNERSALFSKKCRSLPQRGSPLNFETLFNELPVVMGYLLTWIGDCLEILTTDVIVGIIRNQRMRRELSREQKNLLSLVSSENERMKVEIVEHYGGIRDLLKSLEDARVRVQTNRRSFDVFVQNMNPNHGADMCTYEILGTNMLDSEMQLMVAKRTFKEACGRRTYDVSAPCAGAGSGAGADFS
jgi:hypothetical protein